MAKRFRSAVTGRFITAKEALAKPARSIAETIKRVVNFDPDKLDK